MDVICQACGEANPAGTEFCRHCNEFLAWDRTSLIPRVTDEAAAPSSSPQGLEPEAEPTHVVTPEPKGKSTQLVAPTPAEVSSPLPASPPDTEAGPPRFVVVTETVSPTPPPVAPRRPTGPFCPGCGDAVATGRHFCPRCGYESGSGESVAPQPTPGTESAVSGGKGEYLRSLPPLYRWRWPLAVAAGALALSAVVAFAPIGALGDAWERMGATYSMVIPTGIVVSPAAQSAVRPERLIDGTVGEFTMSWAPAEESSTCEGAKGTNTITISIPPTRIRWIQIYPGLAEGNSARGREPVPKTVGIHFDGVPAQDCLLTLKNKPEMQGFAVDSGTPVTQVSITIGSTYPGGPDSQPLISLTEVALFASKK